MEFLQVVILFLLLLMFINLLQNLRRLQGQENIDPEEHSPFISILIPARNEEKNIKNCVISLFRSDYSRLEIIVLDDNSSDRTYEIVKKFSSKHKKLKIIKGRKLPPGWTGKNWACHQLSQEARGDWLLFTDADTIHKPQSVSIALAATQRRKSVFVTCIPGLITKTWAEKLFLPIIHFAFVVLLPFKLINYHKDSRLSFGIGPFLFIEKEFYFSFGGHRAVRTSIVDDMALAKKVKESDGKISILDGTKIMDVRFSTCVKEVWNGFSKNSYEAIGSVPHFLFMIIIFCYFLFIYPYLSLWGAFETHQNIAFPLFQVMTISLIKIILSLRFRTSFIYGLLHPFAVTFWVLILLNSFRISFFKKKIEWKERLYPVE